jgi:hypothetical protein
MGIKKGQDRPGQGVCEGESACQTAGGSGAIRRYGRRAVNGEAARKRGCGKGKDVRMKPRRIKARQGRPRATSRSNVDERQGMVVRG